MMLSWEEIKSYFGSVSFWVILFIGFLLGLTSDGTRQISVNKKSSKGSSGAGGDETPGDRDVGRNSEETWVGSTSTETNQMEEDMEVDLVKSYQAAEALKQSIQKAIREFEQGTSGLLFVDCIDLQRVKAIDGQSNCFVTLSVRLR